MKRSMKNTVSVLIATVMTALAIFSAVTFTDVLVGSPTTSTVALAGVTASQSGAAGTGVLTASASGALQYCPRTGCSATSCHATQGR